MKYTPDQFKHGEAWVAFRVDCLIQKQAVDIYVLMDASSGYAFGHVIVEGELPGSREIGELMKCYPKIKGIFRKSWFLDPDLENVNPEIAYLREIPQHNGAILFEAGTAKSDIRTALSLSPYRRKLYKEGKYLPTVYGYIWPRNEFLGWLSQSQAVQSG